MRSPASPENSGGKDVATRTDAGLARRVVSPPTGSSASSRYSSATPGRSPWHGSRSGTRSHVASPSS
eukprot:5435335-Lingulodinium_polyedra.AAC.1